MVNLKQMLQTSWFASEFLAGWHLTAKPSTLLARNQSTRTKLATALPRTLRVPNQASAAKRETTTTRVTGEWPGMQTAQPCQTESTPMSWRPWNKTSGITERPEQRTQISHAHPARAEGRRGGRSRRTKRRRVPRQARVIRDHRR
jgi:hypothetical protein